MDRTNILLKHITKDDHGIEIGPYHNPLAPRRFGFNSLVLDVFEADELRRRATEEHGVSAETASLIEGVDLLGSAAELRSVVRAGTAVIGDLTT